MFTVSCVPVMYQRGETYIRDLLKRIKFKHTELQEFYIGTYNPYKQINPRFINETYSMMFMPTE